MSYASDKLYNGYLRTNMAPSSIIKSFCFIHLIILFQEAIETKNDSSGKYEAMKLLLSLMKRRENWPEQFIAALEECEHRTMAHEIRGEYNKLKAINSKSLSPLTTTAPLQENTPKPGSINYLFVLLQVTTPPEPPQVQAEPQTQAVVVPPVTPPPSPESARGSTSPSPPPEQEDIISHQEPEENLEPAMQAQDVPNETINIPEEVDENTEAALAAEPQQEPCENDDSMESVTMVDQPAPVLATAVNGNTPLIDVVHKPIIVEPEPVTIHLSMIHMCFYFCFQVVEIVKETQATPSPPANAENDSVSEEDICFSKPGVLMSVQPPDQNNTTMRPCSLYDAPFSGDSGRLEMSEVEKSAPSCQENGLEEEDVQENVGYIAEEPSILNLEVQQIDREPHDRNPNQEVQTPIIQVNGEPAREINPVPPEPAPATNDNHLLNDPLADENPLTDRLNTRYILTAAGVGACALLVAWKYNH
uniref:Caspase recruitment domain-containing protein n=1 Tax=Neogobius melanostomus TaxID=47308 RepID=A0A8C6T285_9GOBI